jgi:hypothetical protein
MLKSHFQAIRCADKVTFVLYSPLTVLSFWKMAYWSKWTYSIFVERQINH